MIKFISTSLFLLAFSGLVMAQSSAPDVLYLKNGSIIRGTIISQGLNQPVKIETADKSVFVFDALEVERVEVHSISEASVTPTSRSHRSLAGVTRRGYVGFSFGPSVPIGDYSNLSSAPKVGMQFNLGHFGYLFSKNVGICASLMGGVNPLNYGEDDDEWDEEYWSYGAMMVGPMISFPFSPRVEWDIRPMIGVCSVTTPKMLGEEQGDGMSYCVGSALRFNVNRVLALMLTADYLYSEPSFDTGDLKVETLAFGVGIAFRLK